MEPVLMKYKHIFHREGSNAFKGTDLVEHRIVTGDRPGSRIRHADTLSRHVHAVTRDHVLSKDVLRKEQQKDTFVAP
jgi:hypothetical protein